ncbi:NACHT and WD repeat domain-containing protein 2 [Xenopus laevis]|nr:NACHT and WD repeat domain-containing protein 2 [Xenopus laevis]
MNSEKGGATRPSSYSKLCHLRDTFIPALACNGPLCLYSTTTTCNIKVGYTEEKEEKYIEGLCNQFYSDTLRLIEKSFPADPLYCSNRTGEAVQHLSLCSMYSSLQQFSFREEQIIHDYILHDKSQKSMVVFGKPGCGKTVLLASCAGKVHLWLEADNPFLVMRFICPYWEPLNPTILLRGLCHQLSDIYQRVIPNHLDNVADLRQCLVDLMSLSSKQTPLILIMDDIDYVTLDTNSLLPWWLTTPIPPFTKIIVSVTQKQNVTADQVKSLHEDQFLYLELQRQRRECNENLKQCLLEYNRKITSGQQMYVNRSLETNTSPLQVHLLFKIVTEWKSHQDVDSQTLGVDSYESAERLFHKFEIKYSYEIVSRTLSYITLSGSGIGVNELIDLLTADDLVIDKLHELYGTGNIPRMPEWIVTGILLELKGCLSDRMSLGCKLVYWNNQMYQQVIMNRYLSSPEIRQQLHTTMYYFFSGRWPGGRFISKALQKLNSPLPNKCLANDNRTPNQHYLDYHPPSQPWFYHGHSVCQRTVTGNVRKAHELPFHLKQCGKLEKLYNEVFMAFPYYKVLVQAGQLHLLLNSIEDAVELIGKLELYFICDVLKEASCLLKERPDSLEMIFQSKLLPLGSTYPPLLKMANQVYGEGRKKSSIKVLCSPLIRVPFFKVCFPEASSVIRILEMKGGPLLMVVFENGSVYTWAAGKNFRLRFKGSVHVKDVSVDNECRYLALCTLNHSFLLLDCLSWTVLNDLMKNIKENQLVPKHFSFSETRLMVCFDNSSNVRVFDVPSGELIDELVFSQEVTFFSCDSMGKYTVMRQTNNIFIYDNQNLSIKISLPVDLVLHVVHSIHVHETMVYIIDKASKINVWSITNPAQPLLLDELGSEEEYGEVVSTEYSPPWLLICRAQYIEVRHTESWERHCFKPPRGQTLIFGVFSQSCEEVIAAVESVPFLFVWDRESGQCISKISLELGIVSMLTKCRRSSQLAAVIEDKALMLWDLKSVVIPTSYFQTGRPVESLILCPQGNHAYTRDSSDLVCRWDTTSCRITDIFQHCNTVEAMALAAMGEILVTSVTSGGLYVWLTCTGENLHFIQTQPISQILITPNSYFVVTLCEHGISKVWRPTTATVVCYIQPYLQRASINSESTFIIGLQHRRLVAISLWSGRVCKRFHCEEGSDCVLEFKCLKGHPDFIVVITSRADFYTWNMAEGTVCHQFKFPLCNWFQLSSNGRIMATAQSGTINVINTHNGQHCIQHTSNPILHQHLTMDGVFLLYIGHISTKACPCDFHINPVLQVIRVSSGETIDQFHLGKLPSTMSVSEDDRMIFIGFEDGTLGLYSLSELYEGGTRKSNVLKISDSSAVKIYKGKSSPTIIWADPICLEPSES